MKIVINRVLGRQRNLFEGVFISLIQILEKMDGLKKQRALKIQMELVWWLVTGVFTYLVLYPIMSNFTNYKFIYANTLFVIVFVTYARYIFLLKHTFLAHFQALKFILVFVSIPLTFHLIELLQNFQYFLDTEGQRNIERFFTEGTSPERRNTIFMYMSREMVFFGVASIIVVVMMPFRMLVSFWRVYNKTGTV